MDAKDGQTSSYRVEVSGWDEMENFFVEKAIFRWEEKGRQQLNLKSRLREDSVIFVRLLQPLSSEENFPVPYVVSKLLTIEMNGRSNILISRLHPKPALKQAGEALEENSTQVA